MSKKKKENEKVCVVCGKQFRVCGKKQRKTAKFCSMACRKKTRIKKECPICGKIFYISPSTNKQNRGKFCSRKCYSLWKKGNTKGKNAHNWKGGKIKTICKFCGKEFYITPSLKGTRKFCSRECDNKWRSKYVKGEKHHQWTSKKRKCLVCGKTFYAKPSLIKKGGGKFCSCSCAGIWNFKHMFKTKDTSIELKVEDMLIKLGIEFEKQKVISEGRTVADFYVPAQRLVLYADGVYWHSLPGRKKKDMNQDFLLGFNNYNVLRLGEDDINKFPKKCLKKIQEALYEEHCQGSFAG